MRWRNLDTSLKLDVGVVFSRVAITNLASSYNLSYNREKSDPTLNSDPRVSRKIRVTAMKTGLRLVPIVVT